MGAAKLGSVGRKQNNHGQQFVLNLGRQGVELRVEGVVVANRPSHQL